MMPTMVRVCRVFPSAPTVKRLPITAAGASGSSWSASVFEMRVTISARNAAGISDRQRRFRKSLGDSRSHSVTPIGGTGSSPSHHLELRRPGGGEALTYAVDVRWPDVDAQQDRALSDLSLQGLSRFAW
jgi:hypothetical protein